MLAEYQTPLDVLIFKFQIRQFKKRDEAVNACVNLALTEGQISTCKATQTDFHVPESAGKRSKLLPRSEIFPFFTLLQIQAHCEQHFVQKYRSVLAMSKDEC